MGPAIPEGEEDVLRELPRRLRFAEPSTERRYRQWRTERAIPFVRAGMVAALVGGFVILATGQVADAAFGDHFVGLVLVVSPPFLAAIAITFVPRARAWQQPVAAFATAWWGLVVVWGTHGALDAPGLGTTAVLLVGFFGLTVFRLSPGLGVPVVLSFAALHQILIVTTDEALPGSDGLHSVLTWLILVATVLMAVVLERVERTQFAQLELITSQRDTIRHERERADLLLYNIMPRPIADRLKASPGLIADFHDGVSVLFADVVGFTPLSARLPAAEVVSLLDEVFHRLDEIVDRHGVEKIKTVGDAYMAVAGAPDPREDHAEAVAEVALDIVSELRQLSASLSAPIEMRIGIASGDAVAGVIGRHKFAYDLWSDTVNTASRMESHGLPGRIQVTAETARRLTAGYHLSARGVVDLKGKGPTATWLLDGRRDGCGAPSGMAR